MVDRLIAESGHCSRDDGVRIFYATVTLIVVNTRSQWSSHEFKQHRKEDRIGSAIHSMASTSVAPLRGEAEWQVSSK